MERTSSPAFLAQTAVESFAYIFIKLSCKQSKTLLKWAIKFLVVLLSNQYHDKLAKKHSVEKERQPLAGLNHNMKGVVNL